MTIATPTAWYDRLVLSQAEWQQFEGVPVAMATIRQDPVVMAQVVGAVSMIAAYSPATLRRLLANTRGLLIGPLYGARGEWRQSLGLCLLSLEYLRHGRPSTPSIAATIVHELAHARMDAVGIACTTDRLARIERICLRSSQRFLQLLPESRERDAALVELDEYLSFGDDVWQASCQRDNRPWLVRLLARGLRRIGDIWHRVAPT